VDIGEIFTHPARGSRTWGWAFERGAPAAGIDLHDRLPPELRPQAARRRSAFGIAYSAAGFVGIAVLVVLLLTG
jgi:hypothetical protein